MTKREFMKSRPIELVAYGKAHRLKQQMKDEELWLQGRYNMEAFAVVLSHMLNKNSKAKYLKTPISHQKTQSEMTEEQLQKQRELFVAKLMAMQKNFEINHKDGKVS